MFIRITHRRRITEGLGLLLLGAAAVALLSYPEAMSTGISRGMSVCSSVVIPTLYPFMLLSGFLADSSVCRHPGRIAEWIAGRLFGLPGCCAPAILLSLTGGYPAGMMAIARLYRQGQIDREQLHRMTAFCIGAGPGFVIGTVGAGLMGSPQAGVLLYAAQTVVSIGIGVFLGRGHRREQGRPAAPTEPPRSIARVVGDTCGSLLTMCGFVGLAAMVLALLEGMGVARWIAAQTGLPATGISAAVAGVLEVSCGCVALSGMKWAPLWLSLTLSWAGLSVQGQLTALLPEERILTPRFWGWRMCHGLLSGGLTLLLFRLFPVYQTTGAGQPQALPYSVSTQSSVMLLLLCFLAMVCFSGFSEKKTGKSK